ncbi:probable RNA polymerase II nuclear localization protein SLC7A6OS [Chelonus insularis]|uniref:probable RNA polymerase II nuclear localization protein SLC7A6OS n=1 Tax=Chelonus insularis TaxID=460826 RepID=UPI00158F1474|nr:probable RNA polymerase II nuclear localization protein SLC7A6OS [Chelonus insularis]
MATVLRVKRRNSFEPLNTLVIACKKQKISDDKCAETSDSEDVTTVLKLAGTVQTQDDVVKQIAKTLSKDQLKENYKQNITNITAKNRIQARENSKQQRYKVISCFRSLNSDLQQLDEKGMTVIDVEDSVSCTATKSSSDQDNDYVYDLYYTKTEEGIEPENFISVYTPGEDLVFDHHRESPNNSDIFASEDSNSESNWRNEYPDSDYSNGSIDEDDMREAVMRVKIEGEGSDLSDEDDHNDGEFVYTVDEADVENYGYAYAYYKAKMIDESFSDSEMSDHSGVYISEINDVPEDEESDIEEED